MEELSELQIDHRQMVVAIETTVDLVGMNDTHHGKRVGYIASQMAHALGMSDAEIQFIFELGLLHDCGVSSDQVHGNLVSHFDWEDAHIHCEIGSRLLSGFEPLAAYAVPILYHHTPWCELQGENIEKRDERLANMIFLADRVDVMAAAHYGKDILLARRQVIENIRGYSGEYFDPELIEVLCDVERSEAFWIALEDRHIVRYAWDMERVGYKQNIKVGELRQMARILSYIVDQKSPFTAQHSARVAILARYLAIQYGLSAAQVDKIEIAGFLHDIGKLRTPDGILTKPGPLNPAERSIMNHHSFETYEILRQIDGLQDIAVWAAYHHEEVNRGGYPFHPKSQEFSIEARIIAVADVFQALVQDRPYRKGMHLDEVVEILDNDVGRGKLDTEVVEIAKINRQKCFEIAAGTAEENIDNEVPVFDRELFEGSDKPLV